MARARYVRFKSWVGSGSVTNISGKYGRVIPKDQHVTDRPPLYYIEVLGRESDPLAAWKAEDFDFVTDEEYDTERLLNA